jgi:hypothetical protein
MGKAVWTRGGGEMRSEQFSEHGEKRERATPAAWDPGPRPGPCEHFEKCRASPPAPRGPAAPAPSGEGRVSYAGREQNVVRSTVHWAGGSPKAGPARAPG